MTTLVIKDLSVTTELDRAAMADVRGGFFGFSAYMAYAMHGDVLNKEQQMYNPTIDLGGA